MPTSGIGSVSKPALGGPPTAPFTASAFGGGKSKSAVSYDPLEWSDFFDSKEMINDRIPVFYSGTEGHVFVCFHGAGHSAMSFGALAKELKLKGCRTVAFDWRGHG
jgi:protein phosphatase methylesterase 1